MKKIFNILVVSILLITTLEANSGNIKITSFSKAKKILKTKIYNEKRFMFGKYSGCTYEEKKILRKTKKTKKSSPKKKYINKLVVDKESCGYIPRTKSKRANFIEWEHLQAAQTFGKHFNSWYNGNSKCFTKNKKTGKKKYYKGRRCTSKVSKKFKLMEADLFNLVPVIGEINADRSNYQFTELPGEPRVYGKVNFEVNSKARKAEPNDEMKGQIARVHLYFKKVYGLKLSSKQEKLYKAWNKMYKMTELEKIIIKKKEKIQGNKFEY